MLNINFTNGFIKIDTKSEYNNFTCACEILFSAGKTSFGKIRTKFISGEIFKEYPEIDFILPAGIEKAQSKSYLEDIYRGIDSQYRDYIIKEYKNIISESGLDISKILIEDIEYSEMASSKSVFGLLIYISIELLKLNDKSIDINEDKVMEIINRKRVFKRA